MDKSAQAILNFRDLNVSYGQNIVVRNVNFALRRGETAAIVGESGSGKTQTILAALRLLPPQAKTTGSIKFEGANLLDLPLPALNRIRGKRIAIIFQEPMSALDPLYPVGAQIGAVLRLQAGLSRRAARERVLELLDLVHIPEPKRRIHAYPHELSGAVSASAFQSPWRLLAIPMC